jgi:hypothetical protein
VSGRAAIHVITELCSRRTGSDADFRDHVEVLMDELVAIEQNDVELSDGTVVGDPGGRRITVELLVLTDDPMYAIAGSTSAIRAAIHAAGAGRSFVLDRASVRTEPALVAA